MKRKLIARPRAELDVVKHFVYFSEQQPRLAARFKLAVRAAFRAIESSPLSGATFQVATIPDVVFRFRKPRGFKNYLVIYQVTDDTVFVLRVLHSSQNLETELRP